MLSEGCGRSAQIELRERCWSSTSDEQPARERINTNIQLFVVPKVVIGGWQLLSW